MKNLFRFVMAVAVLFTASCAKEEISTSIAGGEVEVSFTANLADLGTRYGEGTQVNTLRYEVYSNGAKLTDLCGTTGIAVNVPCTVNLVLIKGMSYDILFWADNGSDIYSINNGVVSFSAQGINANDESRDAFYAVRKGFDPATATSADTNVVLTRPFAQLNAIVTNMDDVNNSVTLTTSTISTKIYTTLNPFAADETQVVGGLTDATFTATAMTASDLANGHISMNYLLAPAAGYLADIAFTFNNAQSVNITNTTYTHVPLKANYKTNIIGNLLTGSTDFNVSIDANWNTAEYYIYEAFKNGGEVKLTENINVAETLVLENGKDVVLDLNGYNITVANDSDELGVGDAIIVTSGTLTIKGNGTVTANTRAVWARGNGNAVINIEGGHFVGATKDFACEVIYASGNGVINISGGTFEAVNEDTTSFAAPQYAVLNLHGNGAAGCNIVVTGGSFKNFDPCDNVSENPKKNFCAAGYTAVQNGDWYEVGVDTTNYAYVANAADLTTALSGDKNILLAPNAVIEGTFVVNKNKTIMSLDPEKKATIKGRVNVVNANPSFSNVKFDRNETDSNAAWNTAYGKSNCLQYKAVVMIYGDMTRSTKFEGCEFYNNLGTHKSAITSTSAELLVDNCYFEGRSSAIYTQANVSVTNSEFKYTGTNNVVLSVNGCQENGGKVIFKNNESTGDNIFVMGQFLGTVSFGNGNYYFDIQGNEGFDNAFYNTNRVTNKTFADGSWTF